MSAQEVLRIVGAFEAAGLRFWLIGGWGVDALNGVEHRAHDDLDIVIDDFEHTAPAVRDALIGLGYTLTRSLDNDLVHCHRVRSWLDSRGHRVDLIDLARGWLAAGLGLPADTWSPDAGPIPDALVTVASAEGTVAGRRVQCCSAAAQHLLLSEFELRPVQKQDLRLLQDQAAGHRSRSSR